MAGKEYTGKDKVVKKMTRDGLTEENLRDGLRINISPKKQEIAKKNKKYQDSVTKDPLHEPSTRAAPLHEEGDPDMAEEVSVEKISHAGAKAAGLKSKQLRQYQKKATREKLRDSAEIPEEDLSQYKDTVKKKQAQSRVTKEQKKASKLSFDDEGTQMVKNAGMGIGKKTMTGATMAASGYAHKKLYEAEDDNASVEAAHASEIAMEQAAKSLSETQARNNRTSGRIVKSKGTEKTSGKLKFSMETEDAGTGVTTASGAMPQANHTIAVDASNPVVPMGTKVVMNGVEYTVEDTGNFARYGVAFDVYYDSHAAASVHGHKTWEAYIADDNGSQTVEVTNTSTQKIFYVSLINQGFDAYANANLNEEQKTIYDGLNITLGNRDYLFDQNSYANAGNGGYGYQIPSEALSDEKFAKMIHEAEKYLGYPYVWGGASPSTSFDCSGFVSWVINNCGNGWNVGRQTAEGLRGCCAQVSPSQAKPGDLIFFQNTYPTSGASHVGIYVGNGMMIHCGNPIQYASTESAYWQQHFLGYGRLP